MTAVTARGLDRGAAAAMAKWSLPAARHEPFKHSWAPDAHMYSSALLDHFQNPRNSGELAPPATAVQVTNPVCGDILRLSARIEEGVLAAVRYQAKGCTASIAAGSALTGLLQGRTVQEAARLRASDVEAAVGGLAPASQHAAGLCVDAVKALLRQAGAGANE